MRAVTLFALAVLAVPAQAQELSRGSQQLQFAADAPVACVVGTARASGQRNASFADNGARGGQITFPNLVNDQTATARASGIDLAVGVICNASHRITVRSSNGGLLRQGAQGAGLGRGGFAQFQAYNVGLEWQGQSVAIGGQAGNASVSQAGPGMGDLHINVAVPAGTTPLVAGTYTDAIVVEVKPAS